MFEWFFGVFIRMGIGDVTAVYLSRAVSILIIIISSMLAYLLARRYLMRLITVSVERTKTHWDDILNRNGVFSRLAQLAPAVIIYLLAPLALEGHEKWITFVTNAVFVYAVIMLMLAVNAFFSAILDISLEYDWSRELPLSSFVQVVKILTLIVGVILVMSILLNQSILYVMGSLGAVTAVLTFVFQDFLVGLVSGIQLTASGLVARGDWISVPKYDADGTISEIGLTTIKIKNADHSITTIPTQSLITESFKNWRGMQESAGRRIKRSVVLDVNSVRRIDEGLLDQLDEAGLLKNVLVHLSEQIKTSDDDEKDLLTLINAQYATNVGLFRAYVDTYLRTHPHVNVDLLLLVRQLAADANGLPIEIYAFSKIKSFAEYEQIQAGIFEHLMAIIPAFNLRAFQAPTGYDVAFRG